MFLRASRRSHVCLRCESRLILQEQVSSTQLDSLQRSPPVAKRWQSSSAAVRVDEEDQETESAPVPYAGQRLIAHEQFGSRRSDGQAREEDVDRNGKVKQSGLRVRHWRPPPTAQLSVNVLGKPGEILVLPDQKHRRRRRLTEAEEQEPRDNTNTTETAQPLTTNRPKRTIRETLAAESTPLSPVEVFQNVEKLRKKLERHIDLAKWKYTRVSLQKGFTKAQLRQYAHEKTAQLSSQTVVEEPTRKIDSMDKHGLPNYIMNNLWKISDPSKTTIASSAPHSNACKKKVRLTAEVVELILKSNRLSRLHELDAATASAGKSSLTVSAKMKMEGSPGFLIAGSDEMAVKQTAFTINSWKHDVVQQQLTAPSMTLLAKMKSKDGSTFRSSSEVASGVSMLLQRHPVVLQVRGREWQVSAFESVHLKNFERELVLLAHAYEDVERPTPQLVNLHGDSARVPVYPQSDVKSVEHYRSVDGAAGLGGTESSGLQQIPGDYLLEITKILQSAMSSDEAVTTHDSSMFNGSPSNVIVEFGQATSPPQRAGDSVIAAKARPHFQSQIPLLPQFLADQHRLQQDSPSLKLGPRSFRLKFKSSDLTQPSLEIHGSPKNDSGIQVQSIALHSAEQQLLVGLPATPVDLQYFYDRRLNLFESDAPPIEKYAPLMAQIADQLVRSDQVEVDVKKRPQSIPMPKLSPLLQLDLAVLSRSKTEPRDNNTKQTRATTDDKHEKPSGHENFSKILLNQQSGSCSMSETGLKWRLADDNNTLSLDSSTIKQGIWSRAAKGFQVTINVEDNQEVHLEGFLEKDFGRAARAFQTFYNVDLKLDPSLSHFNKINRAEPSKVAPAVVRYALDRAEWLDRTVYETPARGQFALEYLSLTPMTDDSIGKSRQALRLVEKSKVLKSAPSLRDASQDIPVSENDDQSGMSDTQLIEGITKAALDTASALGGFVQQRTKEMVSRYPAITAEDKTS
ncbi:hypothetical protein LTR64_007940 [Lithohypha guttulata]|uniref:uncharacterized protein n=1 Tax=Lithohypha guttulata TaxID=1690604 RepID=UPI002DE06F97|nr:hypothetical protein LTR51_008192 [Lithohypha guttulata]